MTTLLRIDADPQVETALVRGLADEFVNLRREAVDDLEVIHRDLALAPAPHITNSADVRALYGRRAMQTPEMAAYAAQSDELIAELTRADDILIATPMHNMTVPSLLKAYIDQVARPRRTFRYTERGSVGLLKDKRALAICVMGSDYSTGQNKGHDFLRPYLRAVLGFIGIEDVMIVSAEGVALNPERREHEIEQALARLRKLAREW